MPNRQRMMFNGALYSHHGLRQRVIEQAVDRGVCFCIVWLCRHVTSYEQGNGTMLPVPSHNGLLRNTLACNPLSYLSTLTIPEGLSNPFILLCRPVRYWCWSVCRHNDFSCLQLVQFICSRTVTGQPIHPRAQPGGTYDVLPKLAVESRFAGICNRKRDGPVAGSHHGGDRINHSPD